MDEIDIALSLALLQNSRTPYRSLASKLNLSVNAIHKRTQAMIESGVIRGFIARPSLKLTGSLLAYIYGQARAEPLNNISNALSKSDSVFWVAQAGGGNIYVGLYIRSLEDLPKQAEFVRKTADMPDPVTGIVGSGAVSGVASPRSEEMDILDWRIIDQLSKDSRKQLNNVASDLDVSAKTIRRRFIYLVKNSLIELTIG